jgi:hypothetical protein
MATTVIAFPLTGIFYIPADFPAGGTLQVECVGAGAGPGGGGGGYSKTNTITGLTAGQRVYFQSGDAGTDTWFNKTTNAAPSSTTDGCLAKCGTFGGNGGQASAGVGDLKYSGGAFGYFSTGDPNDTYGGGGGAAGPNGNGGAGFTGGGGYSGGGGANGGSSSSGAAGGNNRFGTGGGAAGYDGTNGGGGGVNHNGSPELIWTDFAGVQWGPCGGSGGDGNGGTAGSYGGGACRLTDIGAAASSRGLVILTYTTGTAPANYVDAIPGGQFSGSYAYSQLGYYYVPYGVSKFKVEAIGAALINNYGPPSGGGAYASRTLTVTPGGFFYFNVNDYGSLYSRYDTWVNTTANTKPTVDSSSVVLAKGTSSSNSQTGGNASLSFGTVKYSGGNGGTYSQDGWGGSAGPNGPGGNGGKGDADASTNSVYTGGGGGGAANGGSNGSDYANTKVGGSGGNNRLGSGGGAGGNNANAGDGTNGGGGGGGGALSSNSYLLRAGLGSQENIWTTTNGRVFGPGSGRGGLSYDGVSAYGARPDSNVVTYGAVNGYLYSGQGLIVLTAIADTATSNFLQFF